MRRRLTLLGAALVVVALHIVFVQWLTLPSAEPLMSDNPTTTAFIDRYRTRLESEATLPPLRWEWVDYDQISVHMKRAAVVAEDIEFFSHQGFSEAEIREAVRDAIRDREAPRGASTITQQTAKNLWLSPSRNPLRKMKEVILTGRLEDELSKPRILEIYLNVAEFGLGIYGVGVAADNYFGKSASSLSEHESAMLAASLPRPARWNPASDSPYYLQYVEEIEDRLDRADFLWKYVQPELQ
jgi:monofunctional biosynthetic peptidoglycan transglycosylase